MTLTIIAVICAFIAKGMCGFANTLVFSTIMSFTTNNVNITPLELIVGYPSNLYIAWRERKDISTKVWLPLSALVMLGIIPGTLFLKSGDTGFIKILFGAAVILVGIEMLLREKQTQNRKSSPIFLTVIGILSGIFCGMFGIGAILVAYISRTTQNQKQFRGNLCIVFFIENTFRIILYSFTGILNIAILRQAILLLPFMVLGLTIGTLMARKMSDRFVRKAIIVLLILSGVSLIVNNFPL
jgi:uncharacterized membrane protein YfcA